MEGSSAREVFDHKIVLERSGRARLDGPEMDFPSRMVKNLKHFEKAWFPA
jgi:hypothetical protein